MPSFETSIKKNILNVNLSYPDISNRDENNLFVRIGLDHVRASDDIMIYFDGPRNGYVVLMDKTKDMGNYMDEVEEKQEVAFIPAWNMEK
jgi:hypothetical protein